MQYFVISDIHGMYTEFEQLLQEWPENSQLVILGDLMDRGPDSLKVVQKVMALQSQYGERVIFLKGNHEILFLNFLEGNEEREGVFLRNGGLETLCTFYPQLDADEITMCTQFIKENFKQELDFLHNGLVYYQTGQLLFTHAGFDTALENWQDTTESSFIWVREHYKQPNTSGYINIFGHTPTHFIHESYDIWQDEEQKYMAIDGGCVYGGQLNAVLVNEKGELVEKFHVLSSLPKT